MGFNKEIKHLYPCFIAVIKYGYEFRWLWIKSQVCFLLCVWETITRDRFRI